MTINTECMNVVPHTDGARPERVAQTSVGQRPAAKICRHCEDCEAVRSNPAETRPYTRLLRRYAPRNDGGNPERATINSVGQRPTFAANHTICRLKAYYPSYGASPRNTDTRPTALNFFCVPFRRALPDSKPCKGVIIRAGRRPASAMNYLGKTRRRWMPCVTFQTSHPTTRS